MKANKQKTQIIYCVIIMTSLLGVTFAQGCRGDTEKFFSLSKFYWKDELGEKKLQK